MAKKKKYEKVTEIVNFDRDGNIVTQKLTGNTGGYTRETTPALVGAAQTVKGLEPTVKVAQTNFKNAENDLNLAQSRYETALANELKKTGKDYRTKFDDFTKNKISYQTKEQDKENATPKIEKIPIQEANKNLQNELADVQDKFDKWKIANYEKNLAKAQSKPVSVWDKTGGNVTRALQDLVSPLTQGEAYEIKDEKGNKTYLPSYNELRQEEVRNSYGDNLIGKTARFGGDVVYGGTKIAGAAALDAVSGGLGGKALYWTDMAHDNYKNVKNQGYSDKQAIANTAIATGTEFLTEKLLGGLAGRLTGGEASAVENAVSKAVSKVVSNPQAAKLIGSMTSEGLEEFTQEYIGALNDKITLGKDTNLEDLVKDSLYSGLVGAGTAGAVEGGINSINVARPSFNQNNQPIRSQETPIQAPITQNNINAQEQVETTPTRQENERINTQQVQTRVEPQTIETKPVAKLTQQEQQELDTLKDLPFELDEQQERRMDELLLKQNKDLEKNMSPVRNLTDVRDFKEVGSSKVNAYQYDNPEVKPYFQEVAKDMLYDLGNSTKGERYMTEDGKFKGVKRNVPNDIAELLDGENGVKYSYKEIEDGLNAIIKDNGAENKAVAKRLEFYIDQRLRNGYMDSIAGKIPANNEYIETLRNKNVGENPNIPAEMEKEEVSKELEEKNVITIKNDNLQNVSKDKIKGENTGVSIGDKEVQLQIPTNSKPNKLGQYIPKDGFTKTELKDGKIGDSKFYKNATERADFIRDEVRQKVQEDDYVKHYKKVTNEESMQEAFNDLNTRGTEAIADFFNNNKELTSKDTAMGWLLIEQSQENGDYDFANQVLRKMRENASKTGQTMQMYNYYARLTPEGMYKWAGDQLLRAEEIFEKGKTKKWIEQNKDRWQLNGEETEFIKNQMNRVQELNKMNDSDTTTIDIKGKEKKVTVDRAKQVEIAKIQAMIENKIPPKKGQALNAWMRISMLGNLKTIGTRNPLGNIALRPVNDVGDFVGSIADYALSKVTGYRTKGNFNPSAQVKGLVKGASETIQDARLGIDTKNAKGNRFEIGQGKSFNERHEGVAKVLNPFAKLGNKADSGVSFLLDLGDRPFYNATYEQSLQNQMKLNGIDNIDNVPDWMKNIAEKEALERTYQDDNNYTSAVIDIRNAMNKFNVKGYGLGDVLIPFAKTPANLTKAIVDYSPAGFVSAITKGNELRTAINNGQFTPEMQHTFVNQLGKATAGTLLYVLGASLAKSGITTGGADDDKDVADFMRNTLGIQPYSIKIGDKTFTYDWAQPVASSFAIPADIKKGIKDAKEGEVDLEYIIHQAFSTSGAILLEQSFLQGIKDVLGGYGDPIDNLMSEIEGLPARAIPTFLQQLITYSDSTKRMSYGNKGIDNAISQAQAKTPWAKDLPVYRNSMGKEVKMYGGKNTFFNVFLNPANYSEGNASKSAKEIYKVYQATNDKSILPRLVDSNLKNEDGTKLTNQQKSDFLKISGDIIEKNVDDLRSNDEYNSMSDEDKAQAIKSIVDYAYNKARKDITGHELSSAYKKAEKAEDSGYAIADYYISKQANKTTKNTSTNNRNRYQELANKGIDGRTYDDFKAFVSTAKGESRTGGLTKKQKIINYIEELPLTAQEKQNLYDDYLENTGMFQYYK